MPCLHWWYVDTSMRSDSKSRREALHDFVKVGNVRHIGATSMYAYQYAKALYIADRHGWTRFVRCRITTISYIVKNEK